MASILDSFALQKKLSNHNTGYRSVCTVLHPVRLWSLPLRVIANVSDLARSFCIDAYSPESILFTHAANPSAAAIIHNM